MITEKIKVMFPKLRKSEQQVAKYILKHTNEIEKLSLEQLSEKANVSQPTVLRMLNTCGYKGYKEAKYMTVLEWNLNKQLEQQP